MSKKAIITPVQIRFSDIDGMLHVGNSIYQDYFDLGRVDFFQRLFGKKFFEEQSIMIVVRTEIDYKVQTFLTDDIEVVTQLTKIGNKSIQLEQVIRNCRDNTIHVRCLSIMSGYNKVTGQSIVIPEQWRTIFSQYLP